MNAKQEAAAAKKAEEARQQKIAERNAKMAGTLRKYRNEGGVNGTGYEDSVTHNGRKSKVCGDELSHAMAAVEPGRAMAIAEALLGLEAGTLAGKYEKLNPGQQKMNSVNRIRAALKREDLNITGIKKAIRAA